MSKNAGRVIGVFGLPLTGKSTLINTLVQTSREVIACISSGDIVRSFATSAQTEFMNLGNLFPDEDKLRAELLHLINNRRASGAEIIFLDGFPRTDDQVKWMLTNQLIGHEDGSMLIQIRADNLLARARLRNRDDQDDAERVAMKIHNQVKEIYKLDSYILSFGLPYYTVMNDSLEQAAIHLARIVGLKK